jgi:hypothetical protein
VCGEEVEVEWGSAEVVAAVSVGVAALAVMVTGVSIWVNFLDSEKRRAHAERMQGQRLAHERRLTHQAEAAKAYRSAAEVGRWINLTEIEKAVAAGEDRLGSDAKAAVTAAADAMELAKAYAWRAEMVTAAGAVIVALVELDRVGFATIGRLRASGADEEQLHGKFWAVWGRYDDAIEQYRRAISSE